MKFCSKCGKELVDEAVVCTHCGCAVATVQNNVPSPDDEVSVGFCILSVLIPLFGVIYWCVKYKEYPKKARACGIAALISWGVSFLLSFFMMNSIFTSLRLLF